jgi:hypothetical protein
MLVVVEVALIMLRESLVLEHLAAVEMAPQRIILEKLERLILAVEVVVVVAVELLGMVAQAAQA